MHGCAGPLFRACEVAIEREFSAVRTPRSSRMRLKPDRARHATSRRALPCLAASVSRPHQVFAGQNVGIKEIADKVWLVSFMHYDLGFFDHETGRVECAQNPFEPKVLPMSPE